MNASASLDRPAARGHGLRNVAVGLLLIYAALCFYLAVIGLSGRTAPDWQLAAQSLSYGIAGIAVLTWIYRAGKRAHASGARHLTASPAMGVVWYFVPIANLFMPYMALRDIWKASIDPTDWEAVATPALVKLWWATWISGNIIGLSVLRIGQEVGATPALATWSAAADGLTMVCALCLSAMIVQIEAFEPRA